MTDFLGIELSTAILSLLNLLVIFLILKHFLFKKVNDVINSRQAEVDKAFNDADAATAKAEALESEYADKISKAKEESAEIVQNATRKAQIRSDELINEAKNEASSIITKANSDIEREKKKAVNEIKDEISEIAFMVASKVVDKEISKSDNEKLIEEFINNVGEL